MDEQVTIRTICRIMVPFIQLYGFYVIAHGDLGPGGGFQGGVILASSIILLTVVLGREEGRKRISEKASTLLAPTGVLIYAGIGTICMIFGGAYLEYSHLFAGWNEHLAIHLGIYGIEIGVGITVAVSMVAIFFEMADKRDD